MGTDWMKYLAYGALWAAAAAVYFCIGTALAIAGHKLKDKLPFLLEDIWGQPGFVVGLWPMAILATLVVVAMFLVLSPLIGVCFVSMYIGDYIERKF